MSKLVIMGSGETAPTLMKVHRSILRQTQEAVGHEPVAVMLDTTFGFQLNADDLVAKTQTYFRNSVGHDVQVASWRGKDEPTLVREQAIAAIRGADWVFAGPGSPSYTLRQWRDTAIPEALADSVRRGGTLVLGSAAALTAGAQAIPVYEIYKVGEDPHWLPALDLVNELTGLPAVVIAHYNNNEGGHSHDTRFCYLGAARLERLERELPETVGILGVDEHTCVTLDLATQQIDVSGVGRLVLRRGGHEVEFPAGSQLSFHQARGLLLGTGDSVGIAAANDSRAVSGASPDDTTSSQGAAEHSGVGQQPSPATSLRVEVQTLAEAFDTALSKDELTVATQACLDVVDAIQAWSQDSDQNSDARYAQDELRRMVTALGSRSQQGITDLRPALSPLMDTLLRVRANARANKDFATSDLIRDELAGHSIEVRDTPDGAVWELNA